jgi:hypothetical protein
VPKEKFGKRIGRRSDGDLVGLNQAMVVSLGLGVEMVEAFSSLLYAVIDSGYKPYRVLPCILRM